MRAAYEIIDLKNGKLIRCNTTGFVLKSRAMRLAEALNCRWHNRKRGYIATNKKAEKFKELYSRGWDAEFVTKVLIAPTN